MAREFIVEYDFTSTKADGDCYKRRLIIEATNAVKAVALGRIEGFREFGARFNDNCFDWNVVGEVQEDDKLVRVL